MKKPLVSSQDLEKLKQEEVSRRERLAATAEPSSQATSSTNEHEEEEELDSVLELSNDACFNLLLKNGSSSLTYNGPAVVRTRNAEIRAEKAAAAARALSNTPDMDSSMSNNNNCSSTLPDEASYSRASSSLSSVEQRTVDFEKRQAWRQARLQSMDVESKRTDEVIKLITSIPSSPIPIQ
uniref:Uncharacterized protein n=1 Tax=Ditylenchus dipsaci TaxID=166011 RepID=A0A915E151_9BILA